MWHKFVPWVAVMAISSFSAAGNQFQSTLPSKFQLRPQEVCVRRLFQEKWLLVSESSMQIMETIEWVVNIFQSFALDSGWIGDERKTGSFSWEVSFPDKRAGCDRLSYLRWLPFMLPGTWQKTVFTWAAFFCSNFSVFRLRLIASAVKSAFTVTSSVGRKSMASWMLDELKTMKFMWAAAAVVHLCDSHHRLVDQWRVRCDTRSICIDCLPSFFSSLSFPGQQPVFHCHWVSVIVTACVTWLFCRTSWCERRTKYSLIESGVHLFAGRTRWNVRWPVHEESESECKKRKLGGRYNCILRSVTSYSGQLWVVLALVTRQLSHK